MYRNISVLAWPHERREHTHRTISAVRLAHEMRKMIATSWWSYDHTRCAKSSMLDCKENNTPPARVSSRPAKRTSADCLPLQHLQRCANLYSSCRCVHTHPVQGLPPPDRLSANRTANLKTERAGGKRRRNLGYPYGILACAQWSRNDCGVT